MVSVEPFGNAAQALKAAAAYDLLIIDGPARTSAATLEIAKAAGLVVPFVAEQPLYLLCRTATKRMKCYSS